MTLDPTMLLYTYISRFSVTPHYIKSGRVAATNAVPQPFLIAVSTSLTNGPRLLSQVKVVTHSPSPTGSHTAAHTPKHGPSRRGRQYDRSRRAGPRGNPLNQRRVTQASGCLDVSSGCTIRRGDEAGGTHLFGGKTMAMHRSQKVVLPAGISGYSDEIFIV